MAEQSRQIRQEPSFRNIQLLRREELGHGSYGIVCKAQCDQLICAAKIIYRTLLEEVVPDPGREHRLPQNRFRSEIEFLKTVHHPNIVQYLGTHEDPESGVLVLLMELMDESLTHFLESSPGDITYHIQVNLSYDIAQALAFIHANGIIHRDLSSNNVLLLAGTRAKITDFGMSKFAENSRSMTLSPGTQVYMPPEALNQPPAYTKKLDNFSFGVILVQIVTKLFPAPAQRVRMRQLVDPESNTTIQAQVPIPEVERRHGHISLVQQDHPLLPIALDCLKDKDEERPSSQELCQRLRSLKRSDAFKQTKQQNVLRATLTEEVQAQPSEIASREGQLRSLNEQLEQKEQIIATLQQDLLQKNNQVRELREALETKDQDNKQSRDQQSLASEAELANSPKTAEEAPTLSTEESAETPNTGERSSSPRASSRGDPCNINWEFLPDAIIKISAGSSAVIGHCVYFNPSETRTICKYDSSAQKWSLLRKLGFEDFTLVNVENTLTTVGGSVENEYDSVTYDTLYSYENEEWEERLPPMLTKRSSPAAVYANKMLVVVGGEDDDSLLDRPPCSVEILNTSSGQWSSVSSLPFSSDNLSAVIYDGYVYVLDTGNSFPVKCSIETLPHTEADSGAWEWTTPPPVQRSALTCMSGHLIAVGGVEGTELSNKVYQYNKDTSSWTVASRMFIPRCDCLTALLPDNKLIVVGGCGHQGVVMKTVERATITD